MNIFILSSGRCGSLTFVKACSHITNFTSSHEANTRLMGDKRLAYPNWHIESDNRLSWFLGRLDRIYGNDSFYVHLKRSPKKVARSYSKRIMPGMIIDGYYRSILMGLGRGRKTEDEDQDFLIELSLDYTDTVNSNIELFLKDKDNKQTIHLEKIKEDFPLFWNNINAEGNLELALREWDNKYNSKVPEYIQDHLKKKKSIKYFLKSKLTRLLSS